jgi:hypothetical protein
MINCGYRKNRKDAEEKYPNFIEGEIIQGRLINVKPAIQRKCDMDTGKADGNRFYQELILEKHYHRTSQKSECEKEYQYVTAIHLSAWLVRGCVVSGA